MASELGNHKLYMNPAKPTLTVTGPSLYYVGDLERDPTLENSHVYTKPAFTGFLINALASFDIPRAVHTETEYASGCLEQGTQLLGTCFLT